MTPVNVDTIAKPEPKRDSYGRYLITAPPKILQSGKPSKAKVKPRSYTRATTVAKTLEDTYKLNRWSQRMVAYGMGLREDLRDLAMGHNPDDSRQVFENIVDEASTAAETARAANKGTALHRFFEMADQGEALSTFPRHVQPHIKRYKQGMATKPFEIVHEHTEQVIALDDYKVAGMVDRFFQLTEPIQVCLQTGKVINLSQGDRIVGDIKTGRTLEWGWLSMTVQAAVYANHSATWNVDHGHPQGGTRGERVSGLRRDVALLIHVPAVEEDPQLELYWLDLEAGWDAFLTAMEVRGHRSMASKLPTAYGKPEVKGGPSAEDEDSTWSDFEAHPDLLAVDEATARWVRGRIRELAGNVKAVADLRNRWPEELPKPFPESPSLEQVDALVKVLDLVEAKNDIPFGPPRPGGIPETIKRKQEA
ncbi:MAG: hypothetical protein GY926_05610 [bacterium]|nr:hypothetical protein [bacterium]